MSCKCDIRNTRLVGLFKSVKEESRLHGLYPNLCLLYVPLLLLLYLNVVDSTV